MAWNRCEESRKVMAEAWKKFGDGCFMCRDIGIPVRNGVMAGAKNAGWIERVDRIKDRNVWKFTPEGKKYAERWV